VGPVTGVKS